MDLSRFSFRQIDETTIIKSFDCGDTDLNDFLLDDAKNYFAAMLAVTYLLEDNDAQKTVAFYSLLNDKIVFEPDEKKIWNRINRSIPNQKRRREYPALKIGRLALRPNIQEKALGE